MRLGRGFSARVVRRWIRSPPRSGPWTSPSNGFCWCGTGGGAGCVRGDASRLPKREAAARELREETGVVAQLLGAPAAVFVRAYRADWTATLGLAYAAVVDSSTPLQCEGHQPAAWVPLHLGWDGAFPEDVPRIRAHVAQLRAKPARASD